MMTGRERVKAALTFNHPDRAPRNIWALPYISLFRQDELDALEREFPMDIGSPEVTPGWSSSNEELARAGQYTDEWGSVWYLAEPGVVGEVKEPVLADWSGMVKFQPPWSLIRGRDLSYANRYCEQTDKFMLSECVARPFERLQFLRGSQNLYYDIGYGTKEFRKLLEMVHEYYIEDTQAWCNSNVDAISFMDDWGSAQRLLIQPSLWREIFKPLYKDYCDLAHAAGKYAFFHSDGNITSIYGDLIEVGIDAVNSQLFCMDIEALAKQFKGKITFWGEIDRQYVMPFGKPEEVSQAVWRVRNALDDGRGGLIAQCEWGKDNPMQNVEMVFRTWEEPLPSAGE